MIRYEKIPADFDQSKENDGYPCTTYFAVANNKHQEISEELGSSEDKEVRPVRLEADFGSHISQRFCVVLRVVDARL